MNNKTTMPEPVAYLACNPETNNPEWSESCVCEDPVFTLDDTGTISRGVVFVDQAEAYADVRVREALEEAASIARENYLAAYAGRVDVDESDDDDRNTEIFNVGQVAQALAYSKMEEAIRALIPPTKNEDEE